MYSQQNEQERFVQLWMCWFCGVKSLKITALSLGKNMCTMLMLTW